MTTAVKIELVLRRMARDLRGQDMVEYALMAASLAVAVGAVFPQTIGPNINLIFSKVVATLNAS